VNHIDQVNQNPASPGRSPAGSGGTPRVLLFGYNGANNTGSEARLLRIIQDVQDVFGPRVPITVPTLSQANLRRYLTETATVRIVPLPPVFFAAVRRLVRCHDLVLLVEGSCYMDTWTWALLWAYLWATHCTHRWEKACLAYAVDAGQANWFNRRLVRREASFTDLIVTRTSAAAARLRAWGVTAPIEVTADTALTFAPPSPLSNPLASWPAAQWGVVGIAPVDLTLWPVVIRPFGSSRNCYRWPYYFSRSVGRVRLRAALVRDYARLLHHLIHHRGRAAALVCMEELDEPLAYDIATRARCGDAVRVFSSRQHDAAGLTQLLREIQCLVTSRYHAAVLSLQAAVPQVAVSHDLRLRTLYRELQLPSKLLLEPRDPALSVRLIQRVDELLVHPEPWRRLLRQGHDRLVHRARQNPRILREFARDHGWRIQ